MNLRNSARVRRDGWENGTKWGCLWALVAMVSFVYGFQELNTPAKERSTKPAVVQRQVQRNSAQDITTR